MRAGTALYIVATTAALGAKARAGNRASPSLLIEFPINAEKGMSPLIYVAATRICGPQPGMNPITIAIRGKKTYAAPKILCKSISNTWIVRLKSKNAAMTQAVTKLVSSMTERQVKF